jgi:cell wall-associated NlpC family hydrolase
MRQTLLPCGAGTETTGPAPHGRPAWAENAPAAPGARLSAGHVSRRVLLALALAALVPVGHAFERTAPPAPNATAVVGVTDRHLDAQYWIRQQPQPDRIILDADAIAAQNARLQQQDRSVHDIEQLPARFTAEQVREWIASLSAAPTRTLFDAEGQTVPAETLAALQQALALDRIAESTTARYGLAVHRADLRTFPTRLRVFSSQGDTDIDRFQESALFPGTPVVAIHESRDGEWLFVISRLYAAWIEKRHVALGERDTVFSYGRKQPALIVTGATVRTVYNPEQPGVSELQLDMGVRVPLLTDWPADKPVNGQHPYTSHVIQLPVRGDDGALTLVPALLPRTADVASEYLPLTPANLLGQSFKFLGERYGWGHSYNTRDCSGFVSEVYRSFGVELPRNTRDQGVSPALNRIAFDENDSRDKRLQTLRTLEVGDLIYIPGHVMMVIGQENGQTYLIHDTTGITYRSDGGEIVRAPLNSVAVTPLEPLLFNGEQSFVDRIYSIQRIRP